MANIVFAWKNFKPDPQSSRAWAAARRREAGTLPQPGPLAGPARSGVKMPAELQAPHGSFRPSDAGGTQDELDTFTRGLDRSR